MHGSSEPNGGYGRAPSPSVEDSATGLSAADHTRLSDAYHVLSATIHAAGVHMDTYAAEHSEALKAWGDELDGYAERLAIIAERELPDSPYETIRNEAGAFVKVVKREHAAAPAGDADVTITLTPEQAGHVVFEISPAEDWPSRLDDAEAVAMVRRRTEQAERRMSALGWGHATETVALTESPDWWVAVAAGLLYGSQHMTDTGEMKTTVGDIVESAAQVPAMVTGTAIVEQLAALGALPPENRTRISSYWSDPDEGGQ